MTRPNPKSSLKNQKSLYRDASRGIRLQKVMAEAGVASRRDCEAMIEDGHVRVNGDLVDTLPAWVDPRADVVELDGVRLSGTGGTRSGGRSPAKRVRHTYLMVHKPRGVISTNEDPEGRKRVIDLIDAPINARLFPVGRLDADSTGLILLTDDGELANRLTHPRYEVTKQYQVSVRGKLDESDMQRMRKGLFLADRKVAKPQAAKRASVERVRIVSHEVDRARGDRTTLAITLREGQNREIRRLLARLGYKVRRLKRTAIGPLKLKGIAIGGWRPLTVTEIGMLRKAAGHAA